MKGPDYSKSINACAANYGKDAEAVARYMFEGQERAYSLGNRGPIRFDEEGALHKEISDAYSK